MQIVSRAFIDQWVLLQDMQKVFLVLLCWNFCFLHMCFLNENIVPLYGLLHVLFIYIVLNVFIGVDDLYRWWCYLAMGYPNSLLLKNCVMHSLSARIGSSIRSCFCTSWSLMSCAPLLIYYPSGVPVRLVLAVIVFICLCLPWIY